MVTDMTEGKVLPVIVKFFIPLFLGNLFQQFYSMVDTIIVGKFLGVNALAGVGATGSMNFLIIGFTMGITGGFGVVFSQTFGAKDYHKLRQYIANALYLTVIVSAILIPLTVRNCKKFLILLNTPEDIISESYSYFVVILGGIIVTMIYNSAAAILRSIGDSRTPLAALIVASLVNIVLDILFITVFGMGTSGASIATVLSQAVAGVFCLAYALRHYKILRVHKEEWRPIPSMLGRLLYIGIPMGLQNSVTAVGTVLVQFAVNSLGAVCVAAYTAGAKLRMMFTCGMDMLGMSVSTFCGQNIGAQKKERVSMGVKCGIFLILCFSVIIIGCICLGGRTMASWFVDVENTEVIDKMVYFLKTTVVYCPLLGSIFVLRNTLQGIGYSMTAMFAGIFELAGRSAIVFGMFGTVTYPLICHADPIAWFMANVLLVGNYIYVCRKMKIPGIFFRTEKRELGKKCNCMGKMRKN